MAMELGDWNINFFSHFVSTFPQVLFVNFIFTFTLFLPFFVVLFIFPRSGVAGKAQCRSQWSSSMRRGSAADLLLGLRLRIPPGAWMFVLSDLS
jgi:hypothetical protein